MSRRTGLLVALGSTAVGAALAVFLLLRRRGTPPLLELPPGPQVADDPVADAPISRETRYDEELDAEERRRHEAAERLRSDPLTERLEDENES